MSNVFQTNSPYVTYITSYGQTMPAVDMEYINGLIAAESTEAGKEAKRQNILAALRSLKEEELRLKHQFDTGLLHCQYDASRLDLFTTEIGLGVRNLSELLGKDIKDSNEYLQEGNSSSIVNQLYLEYKKPQAAGISRALERLEGTSGYYYNAMIISDEIEFNANSLRTMSEEDFDSAYANYMTKLDESRVASNPLDATQLANADGQYNRGFILLQTIKAERDQGSSGILVSSIVPILKDSGWNAESIGIGVGESWQLSVILSPSNATNQQVLWSSDNENVLTVNASGWIYGVDNGTATITITSADGNATATSYVRVGTGESGGQEPEVPSSSIIQGPRQILIPKTGAEAKKVTYTVKPQGQEIEDENVAWRIIGGSGITLQGNVVTITSEAEPGSAFMLVATSTLDDSLIGSLSVELVSLDLKGIAVKNQPTKTNYRSGEVLDLRDLVVTLIYEDDFTEDVAMDDFLANGISTTPAIGTTLNNANHDGIKIAITCEEYTTYTNSLIVTASSSSSGSSGSSSNSLTRNSPLAVAGGVQINHTVSGETLSLELPAAKLAEIIEKTGDKEVVFDISAMDGMTSVELQKEAITDIKEAGLDVTLKLPEGTITLNEELLSSIAEQASAASIKIEFKQASPDSLSSAQKEAIKGGDIVLDINILSGTKKIIDFNGNLFVKTPYNGPQPVAVWYLNNKGELKKLACTFSNGIVSFDLDHLSYYVIGQDKDGTGWVNPFIDVQKTDWFYEAVQYAFKKGVIKGTSSNTFSPYDTTTRGMIITILHRLEDSPQASTANSFDDVVAGQYYADAITWAAENSIVSGYGNSKCGPNDPITREQMAVILANYAGFKGYDMSGDADISGFDDADSISSWALSAMTWAQAMGLIQGDGINLMPRANAERCQVSAIIQRFIETM